MAILHRMCGSMRKQWRNAAGKARLAQLSMTTDGLCISAGSDSSQRTPLPFAKRNFRIPKYACVEKKAYDILRTERAFFARMNCTTLASTLVISGAWGELSCMTSLHSTWSPELNTLLLERTSVRTAWQMWARCVCTCVCVCLDMCACTCPPRGCVTMCVCRAAHARGRPTHTCLWSKRGARKEKEEEGFRAVVMIATHFACAQSDAACVRSVLVQACRITIDTARSFRTIGNAK